MYKIVRWSPAYHHSIQRRALFFCVEECREGRRSNSEDRSNAEDASRTNVHDSPNQNNGSRVRGPSQTPKKRDWRTKPFKIPQQNAETLGCAPLRVANLRRRSGLGRCIRRISPSFLLGDVWEGCDENGDGRRRRRQ